MAVHIPYAFSPAAVSIEPGSAERSSSVPVWLALPVPRLPQHARSLRVSALASAVWHVLLITTLALVGTRPIVTTRSVLPSLSVSMPNRTTASKPVSVPRIVFLLKPGPSGGGGGGGNRQPGPPRRAQGVGRDRLTLPVASPLVASRNPVDVERPSQQVVLDAVPLASGTAFQAGLPDGVQTVGLSQGPGFGGGVGEGIGTGIGSGKGPGIGPGSGGGFGGGVYRPGGGVAPPTLLKQVIPKYTTGALERRIQGTVELEVVVTRDGIPGAIRLVRSLDPSGLDGEAVQAVRDWRFNPGRLGATPVDVLVTIVLDFRIH